MEDFPTDEEHNEKKLSDEEVVDFLKTRFNSWNFDEHTDEENRFFAFHFVHWTLEVFGQNMESNLVMYTKFSYGDGFSYEDAPDSMHQLLTTLHYGEMYHINNNDVSIRSKQTSVQTPPFVPKWDELKEIISFDAMYERAVNDPEILMFVELAREEVVPMVCIDFTPGPPRGWGVQYILSSFGIDVIPYGEADRTETVYKFAVEANIRHQDSLRAACHLALLAAINAKSHSKPSIDPSMVDEFQSRLEGRSNVPITGEFHVNPGNSIKNLLAKKLLESRGE